MKFFLKSTVVFIIFLFLTSCNAIPPAETIPHPVISSTKQIETLTLAPTKTPSATFTPHPTITNTPYPTAMSTPTSLPVKEVLLQFGVFGGDGGSPSDSYFGRGTPKLILYADGQLLIKKEDKQSVWFEETTLTVSQICSLLSQIESTGFFGVESNGSHEEGDLIYNYDDTTQFSDGGTNYIIQVNGSKHKIVNIYYSHVPYLISEVREVYNLLDSYSPQEATLEYQAQFILLWIEEGLGESTYLLPVLPLQPWPTNIPLLDVLEKDKVETDIYLGNHAKQVTQVLISGENTLPISELFNNRLTYKLLQAKNKQYYIISRPLLPHETVQDFSPYPYEDEEFDLPFACSN